MASKGAECALPRGIGARPAEAGGTLVLGDHEVFIERSALGVLPVEPGDTVRTQLLDGRIRELRVAAIVHDVTSFPHAFSGQVTAFVTPETMEWLGGTPNYNQMVLTVAERSVFRSALSQT